MKIHLPAHYFEEMNCGTNIGNCFRMWFLRPDALTPGRWG
jgi:hypothetical protein